MRLTTGTLLTADTAARTLRYRLVPYGETSRPTSHGPIRIARGVLEAAFGRPYVNLDHDPDRVVGRMTTDDADDALYATVHLFPGPAGDAVLADPPAGASVEVHAPVLDAERNVTGGLLIGAALTPKPAFAGALLTASEAPDGEDDAQPGDNPGDDPSDPGPVPDDTPDPAAEPAPTVTEPEPATVAPDDAPAPSEPEDPNMTETATAPVEDDAVAPATAPILTAATRPKPATTLHDAAATAGAAFRLAAEGRDPSLLLAALTDVTATSTATGQGPDWLGQLWRDDPRPRPFVDSVLHGDLTGIKPPQGWRWNLAPAVADYSGDKADVPSNSPTLTAIAGTLKRLAGAHDVDRAIFDLGETELIEAYWQAMADSYADLSEAYMSGILVAGATNGTTPAGVTVASSAADVVVGAALQVVAGKGVPTAVGLSSDLFAEFLTNPATAALEFLTGTANFGGEGSLGGLRIFLGTSLAAHTAVALDKRAARYFELPGSPIRAQAVNMPNGGIDVGVFGYASGFVTKPTAVVKIIRPTS